MANTERHCVYSRLPNLELATFRKRKRSSVNEEHPLLSKKQKVMGNDELDTSRQTARGRKVLKPSSRRMSQKAGRSAPAATSPKIAVTAPRPVRNSSSPCRSSTPTVNNNNVAVLTVHSSAEEKDEGSEHESDFIDDGDAPRAHSQKRKLPSKDVKKFLNV